MHLVPCTLSSHGAGTCSCRDTALMCCSPMPLSGEKAVVLLEGEQWLPCGRLGARLAVVHRPDAQLSNAELAVRLIEVPAADLPTRCESLALIEHVHSEGAELAGALTGHPFVEAGSSVITEVRVHGKKARQTRRIVLDSFDEFCELIRQDRQQRANHGRGSIHSLVMRKYDFGADLDGGMSWRRS